MQIPMLHKLSTAILAVIIILGVSLGPIALAQRDAPTEHKGVSADKLGIVDAASLEAQLGLSGHIMQLRAITLMPGGRIAKHDHYKRPGLVWMVSGSWVEGRSSGEVEYSASDPRALVEDSSTEHWFFNDGSTPATALVCDIVPAG